MKMLTGIEAMEAQVIGVEGESSRTGNRESSEKQQGLHDKDDGRRGRNERQGRKAKLGNILSAMEREMETRMHMIDEQSEETEGLSASCLALMIGLDQQDLLLYWVSG